VSEAARRTAVLHALPLRSLCRMHLRRRVAQL
jgi:hypothetical protein